jgi:hypothetical protein
LMPAKHLEGGGQVIEQGGRVGEDVLEIGTFLLAVDRQGGCGFLRLCGMSADTYNRTQLVWLGVWLRTDRAPTSPSC